MRLRLISKQGSISKKPRFSNRTVKHSNRTVFACNRENDNHIPSRLICSWHGDANASYILLY